MCESMVERVARAIESVPVMAGTYSMSGEDSAALARAAIEAMREPTDAMLSATEEVVTGYDDFACGDGTLYLSYPGFHDYAINAWVSMIDAALNEQVAR